MAGKAAQDAKGFSTEFVNELLKQAGSKPK